LKIVPVLQRIHAEFGIEPPAAFRQSQEMADFAAHSWWVGAILLLALLWSAFSASPGRFIRHALGKIFWPLQQLRAADVLQKLSIAVSAGRPISGALSTLARYHFDPRIRHKLLFVRNELEHGADVWQSMAAIRLMTQPEVDLMKSAERAGNQSWALEQLAAGNKRRTQRRVERLSELVLPLAVMLLGAFVLFQALTIFLPLIKLLIAQV
jgi:type II secretory pathway component PulF